MFFRSFVDWLQRTRQRPVAQPRRATSRLRVEALEDRMCMSGDYLLVPDFDRHDVLRFDAATGAFVDEFIDRKSGGLNQPWSVIVSPHDGNILVSTGHYGGPGQIKAVLRFDGTTGAFIDQFVPHGTLTQIHSITFGPDGNLYVDDRIFVDGQRQGRIARFDGRTGEYLDDFVPFASGGLGHPIAHVFGPGSGPDKLDLYVNDEASRSVLRYDGTTGAFVGVFVAAGSGGMQLPAGLSFGPDGNLYVTDNALDGGKAAVLRFQGPSGETPGAFVNAFVPGGSGGLLQPSGVLFGPDGNGDGHQDLYVTNVKFTGLKGDQKTGSVKRYDGVSGAFIDDFVAPHSGGLDDPFMATFGKTDPVTLAYRGDPRPVEPPHSYLLVTDGDGHNVLRYDAATGDFIDEFVARKSGDLDQPYGILIGPHDHDLYLSSGHTVGTGPGQGRFKGVLRYDGADGAFLDEFVPAGVMDQPHTMIFGPDGNLYVGDKPGGNWKPQGGRILRFDGRTGALLGEFVPLNSGGLFHPSALVFGPDASGDGQLDLYVNDERSGNVLHYDGMTGAYLGEFVNTNTEVHELGPAGLTFGPDGNLYVVNWGTSSVTRYQGPTGTTPGGPMPSAGNSGADFIPDDGGRFRVGGGLIFGPDGNGDGHQDLYITYSDWTGTWKANRGMVRRYDGVTGAFIDAFVTPGSGGLNNPYFLTFTETDPTTLAYTDIATQATASPLPTESVRANAATVSIGNLAEFDPKVSLTSLFTFTVTPSAAYDQPVAMSFRTADGAAKTSDKDFIAKTGTLTFAARETTKTITIEVKGDSKREANETFHLDLFGLSSNALFSKNRGIGTILSDD